MIYTKRKLNKYIRENKEFPEISDEEISVIYKTNKTEKIREVIKILVENTDRSILKWYNDTDIVNIENYIKGKKIKVFNLERCIYFYGVQKGTLLYEEKNDKCKNNLETMIKRHGEVEGLKKYKEKNNKSVNSLEKLTKKYGEVKAKKIMASKGNSLEKCVEKYGEIEGKERWNKICKTNAKTNTLDYYISLYGEQEGTEKYNKWKLDIGKSLTIDYYKEQGHTEEEAKKLLSDRQSTFSFEKCIEKYGEIEGNIKFNDRQEKWQKTLNTKSDEEKKRINQLKGSGSNAGHTLRRIYNMGLTLAKEEKCLIYYIRFYNDDMEFWKIGITKNTIDKRFGKELVFENKTNLKREVLFEIDSNLLDCFQNEQKILRENKETRIKINYNNFSSYECFSEDIFKGDYNYKIKKDLDIINHIKGI